MNRRTVQQERGRMGSGVTTGRINDTKQRDRISGGSQEGGVFFCAHHYEVKRNPISMWK